MVISHDKSLIGPLSSILSTEDLWDIWEIIVVDGHNARVIAKNRVRDKD